MHTPKADLLNKALKESFDIEVDLTADLADLRSLMALYVGKRDAVIMECGGSAPQWNAEYAKCYLISETVRMFLREIAPRRMSKKKTKR